MTAKINFQKDAGAKPAFAFSANEHFISQRAISPPSPPRSGGEGRGEVVLRVQGREASASYSEIGFGIHLERISPSRLTAPARDVSRIITSTVAVQAMGKRRIEHITNKKFHQGEK